MSISKKVFIDKIEEEIDALIQGIQEKYELKIAELEIENKRLSQLVNKLNTRIEELEKSNNNIMAINQEKGTSHKMKLDEIQIIKDFEELLIENEQVQKFHLHKLMAMWIEIIKTKKLKYDVWSNYFQTINLHNYFFKTNELGLKELTKTYQLLEDKNALMELMEYILNEMVENRRFLNQKNYVFLLCHYEKISELILENMLIKSFFNKRRKKEVIPFRKINNYVENPTPEKAEQLLETIVIKGMFKKNRDFEKSEWLNKIGLPTINSNVIEENQLNNESILFKYGYRIQGKTREQRAAALNIAIKEIGVEKVVNIIEYHIKLRSNSSKDFSNAIAEWEYDLEQIKKLYSK